MVGGYNHNFSYKGRVFHVQSELGGARNPQIVTLVYEGGTILASCKTSYADLLAADDSRAQIEQRLKAQHREMLRRVREGDLDRNGDAAATSASRPDAPSDSSSGASGVSNQPQTEDVPSADAAAPQTGSLDELVFAYLAGNDPRYRNS